MSHTGLSPSMVRLSRLFRYRRFCNPSVLPQPRDESRFGLCPLSLAATDGIDVSFFSSRYLDVSVPWVRFHTPMNSAQDDWRLLRPRFRIQKSPDRRLFASFPELIAGYHVFRRLSMPRHPPYTLSSLTTFIDHRLAGRACRSYPSNTRDNIDNVPTERYNRHFRISPKRCSTTSARNERSRADDSLLIHLQTEKPKTIGQKSRRSNFSINLEPRIHFSKSFLAGTNFSGKNPAERG